MATHRVQALALVQPPGDPGTLDGVGAVAEDEVGAHDAAILTERCGERGLWCRVLQAGDQQAGGHPAALE
jgi:hypothetical protein